MDSRWPLLVALLATSCSTSEESRRPKAVKPAQPVVLRVIVEEPTAISADEDIRLVRIPVPEAPDERSMDNICAIYRNRAMNTAQLVCPPGAYGILDYSHSGE